LHCLLFIDVLFVLLLFSKAFSYLSLFNAAQQTRIQRTKALSFASKKEKKKVHDSTAGSASIALPFRSHILTP
jgi:hypothetical protein